MKKLLFILILAGLGYWGWRQSHRLQQTVQNGTLTAEVLAQIAKSKPMDLLSVKVSADGGTVVLDGHVRTSKDEDELVNLVQHVKDAKHIKDHLAVDQHLRDQGEIEEDLKLTALIKKDLIQEEGLRGIEIHVSVNQKNVDLTGQVPSREQAFLADKIAKAVQGVKQVRNSIQVARN